MSTLYPAYHLTVIDQQPYVADWDAACLAAGVSGDDEEITLVEVDPEDADRAVELAGQKAQAIQRVDDDTREDRYLAVYECGQTYVRLLHVTRTGPALEQEEYRRV